MAADYSLHSVTPILRIFDESKAREFYVDFLGFKVDWEHRFEENFPLYMAVSFGDCLLHLSEHHGDATPGSAVRIATTGIRSYHKHLLEQQYKYARPGLEETPWDTLELLIGDPFGNRIIFFSPLQEE
ncbi:glyoxalase superfamily protein [Paenibacillus nasutitermitis]|uniref:Bleomycin resistance protein n=1 Tax=Paenibacillus nasutitermitis TaxID=1652958 RepID=A0A917DS08_9BACL|nr:glyoxalase superfamily protein [Paenibacillus nasutitermitis]GGD63238.1 bleomycin resistance protein [Paenibacillus nasutitermitis]